MEVIADISTDEIELTSVAIILNPEEDHVAVAKRRIEAGSRLRYRGSLIEIKQQINVGGRFAFVDIDKGEYIKQFKSVFGRARGISKGEVIKTSNVDNVLPDVNLQQYFSVKNRGPAPTQYLDSYVSKTFEGYIRKGGDVGTRNYYLIVPTSMCASATATQVAFLLENDEALLAKYTNLDGILAIAHTEGCGCDSGLQIDRLMRILKNYISHPNVGGCLIMDLGCEQTNYAKMHPYLKALVEEQLKPIDWITIEDKGVEFTREKSVEIIKSRLPEVTSIKRQTVPLEKILVGTECGASDSFSGITANPVIGNAVDKLIYGKGSAIISEIPEMVGVLPMLLQRFRSKEVAEKFQAALDWYMNLAERMGLTLAANLVPKNVEGGLINNYIKSLGAAMKGGTTAIEDVIDYGEKAVKRGLSIMQGPGGDPESVTGLVAAGANIVCFSTGQGTPTGNAICPVIKLSSNDKVYQKLKNDLDFNAGRLISEDTTVDALGDELLDMIICVASGEITAAERLQQRQFQIWTAGKLAL